MRPATIPTPATAYAAGRGTSATGTTATTTSPTTVHTYSENGPVEVSLTVSDSHELASAPATRTVHAGEHPPTLAIADPDPDARFAVGQPVRLTAQASDAEVEALPVR